MKKINTKIGTVIVWYDFIRSKKNKATDTISYDQSNTSLEGYSQRYIGIHLSHNNQLYVAVAVNKREDSGNFWRYIIQNRIITLIQNYDNMSPEDKGVTTLPLSYKDFLFNDPCVYNNLYGLIDPTYLDIVIREAASVNQKQIDRYESRLKEDEQRATSEYQS